MVLGDRYLTWKKSACYDYSDQFTKIFFYLELFFT